MVALRLTHKSAGAGLVKPLRRCLPLSQPPCRFLSGEKKDEGQTPSSSSSSPDALSDVVKPIAPADLPRSGETKPQEAPRSLFRYRNLASGSRDRVRMEKVDDFIMWGTKPLSRRERRRLLSAGRGLRKLDHEHELELQVARTPMKYFNVPPDAKGNCEPRWSQVKEEEEEYSDSEDEEDAEDYPRMVYIPLAVKQKMYELHKEDPAYWTPKMLGTRFQVEVRRVPAILHLMDRAATENPPYAEWEKEKLEAALEQFDKLMIEEQGPFHGKDEAYPQVFSEFGPLLVSLSDELQEKEAEVLIKTEFKKNAPTAKERKLRKRSALPQATETAEVLSSFEPEGGKPSRWKYVVKDTSKALKQDGAILVRDRTKELRTITDAELKTRSWYKQESLKSKGNPYKFQERESV